MSLWNSIKGWMDSPSKNTVQQEPVPEQPAGEAAAPANVDKAQIRQMYNNVCLETNMGTRVFKNARSAFLDWYTGPANEESIKECMCKFKEAHKDITFPWPGCEQD